MPGRPKLSRLPADQGFCSPANQWHTCPQSPAVETAREQACKYPRAGPRPARIVTGDCTCVLPVRVFCVVVDVCVLVTLQWMCWCVWCSVIFEVQCVCEKPCDGPSVCVLIGSSYMISLSIALSLCGVPPLKKLLIGLFQPICHLLSLLIGWRLGCRDQ